jgi:hypothetical protein
MANNDKFKGKKTALMKQGKLPKTGGSSPDQCWFCGKSGKDVHKLIAVGTGSICSECVAAASKLMGRE